MDKFFIKLGPTTKPHIDQTKRNQDHNYEINEIKKITWNQARGMNILYLT